MKRFGIDFEVKNKPALDEGFAPVMKFNRAFLKTAYSPGGSRGFDAEFMSRVYERPFEVVYSDTPPEENTRRVGNQLRRQACRR